MVDSGQGEVIYYQCKLCGAHVTGVARRVHLLMHQNSGDLLYLHRRPHIDPRNAEQNVQGHVHENSSTHINDFVRECGEISHSFECGICSRTFKKENEVEEHRRNHTSVEANLVQNDGLVRGMNRGGEKFET